MSSQSPCSNVWHSPQHMRCWRYGGLGAETYILAGFEARHRGHNLLGKLSRLGTTILGLQFIGESSKLVHRPCDTPPCSVRSGWVALAVDTERGVVLALDQEISSLIAICPPRLDRSRLVQVVFVSVLLVRLVYEALDSLGG